jgi:hypothetical protein
VVRDRWKARAAEMRASTIGDEDTWARSQRIASIGTNAVEARRLRGNMLQGNPDPKALDQSLKDIDTFWGGISAPAEVKAKGALEDKEDAAYNYAHGLNEKDPHGGLAVVESGALDTWLKPEHKKELINEAQTNIRIADADARRQVAQQAAQVRVDAEATDAQISRGELPSDDQVKGIITRAQALSATDPSLKNVADTLTYNLGKLKMSRITDKWTSAEWEAHTNELSAKVAQGKASGDEQQQLKILTELRPAKEARFKQDPDGYAAASGISPPQVDLANPDPGTVEARKSWARAFARTGGLIEAPYLSKDQLATYRDRAAQGPAGQLEVAEDLKGTWGDAAPSIIRQIGGDAKGQMLIMLGLDGRMAQVYGRGRQALDKRAVKLDDKTIGEVWRDYAGSAPPDVAPALLDTARNIAAGWMLEKGFTDHTPANFADVFRSAVQRAAGMLGDDKAGSATGGFVNWNGKRAWLPTDMGRQDFQARISRAAPNDWIHAAVDERGNPVTAVPHHLGSDGKLKPYTKGEALRFGNGTLQTVAPGIFQLIDPMGGTVVDQHGRPYQFDIRRLPRSHFGAPR